MREHSGAVQSHLGFRPDRCQSQKLIFPCGTFKFHETANESSDQANCLGSWDFTAKEAMLWCYPRLS